MNDDLLLDLIFYLIGVILLLAAFVLPAAGVVLGVVQCKRRSDKKWLILSAVCLALLLGSIANVVRNKLLYG